MFTVRTYISLQRNVDATENTPMTTAQMAALLVQLISAAILQPNPLDADARAKLETQARTLVAALTA